MMFTALAKRRLILSKKVSNDAAADRRKQWLRSCQVLLGSCCPCEIFVDRCVGGRRSALKNTQFMHIGYFHTSQYP